MRVRPPHTKASIFSWTAVKGLEGMCGCVGRCLCGDSDYVFDIKEYSSFRKQSDAIRQQELQ